MHFEIKFILMFFFSKWRSLSKEDKERYEEKAKRLAEEQAAKQQEADRAFNESLSQNRSQSPWSDYGRSMSPGANSRPATPGGYSEGKKKSQQKGISLQFSAWALASL